MKLANTYSTKNVNNPLPLHIPLTSGPLTNRPLESYEDDSEILKLKEKLRNAEKTERSTAQVMK